MPDARAIIPIARMLVSRRVVLVRLCPLILCGQGGGKAERQHQGQGTGKKEDAHGWAPRPSWIADAANSNHTFLCGSWLEGDAACNVFTDANARWWPRMQRVSEETADLCGKTVSHGSWR